MKSERTPRERTRPKPVKNIELSERHIKLRVVLVIVFILLALGMFAWAIISMLSTDKGWHKVEASSSEINCSSEFVFYYYIEKGGLSATEELDNVEAAYAAACVNAYRLFNEFTLYEEDELYNLAYINDNPNEVVTVDATLYAALELVKSYNMLSMLYLGPVYVIYDGLMCSSNETEAQKNDPYYSDVYGATTKEYIDNVAAFINSGAISLNLLGNNQVQLTVTAEYESFMQAYTESDDGEEAVIRYLNFGVLRNAFIIDYIADYLAECGYTSGIINSYDGYSKTLGASEEFSITIYDKAEQINDAAGTASGTGAASIVRFRSYAFSSSDYGYKFGYSDGYTATYYLDPQTGYYKRNYADSLNDLVVYSYSYSCAEVLLKSYNIYIAESFDDAALQTTGLYYIYCRDTQILYNDGLIEIAAYGTEYVAVNVD